jgi:hypothetical protein
MKPRTSPRRPSPVKRPVVQKPAERPFKIGEAIILNYGMPGVIERYGGEDEYWIRLHNKDLGRFKSSQFRRPA